MFSKPQRQVHLLEMLTVHKLHSRSIDATLLGNNGNVPMLDASMQIII